MFSRLSAVLCSTLLLVACNQSELAPTAPSEDIHSLRTESAGVLAQNTPSRPFKGSCELTIERISNNFPIVRQRDTGTCQLTHLGRTHLEGILDINVLAGTQVGTRTFTSANGDELYAAVTGTSSVVGPGLIEFSATFTFTGGTGRFSNVSGSAQGTGVANQIARTSSVSLSGTIAY